MTTTSKNPQEEACDLGEAPEVGPVPVEEVLAALDALKAITGRHDLFLVVGQFIRDWSVRPGDRWLPKFRRADAPPTTREEQKAAPARIWISWCDACGFADYAFNERPSQGEVIGCAKCGTHAATQRIEGPYVLNNVQLSSPVPLVLHCPECGARHIDEGDFATKPHHTHACQECGLTWRPAVAPTVGVRFLPGFKNEGPPHSECPCDACDRWRIAHPRKPAP